ncbi:hypothetical protein ANCCAN_29398, partial [Ancylostoma caninum]
MFRLRSGWRVNSLLCLFTHSCLRSGCSAFVSLFLRILVSFSLSHDFIGSCEVPLSQLLSGAVRSLPLINEKKRAKKGSKYKNSGTLEFDGVKI